MKTSSTLRSVRASAIACAAFALNLVGAPRVAHACGGTFCDIGPRAMPVDQTGENILFVIDSSKVEAHIQIQYRGDAARFSWILPVPALPEIEVGSDPLFAKLLAGTVPTFGYSTQRDGCNTGGSTGVGGSGGGLDPGSVRDAGGGVVVAQKQVGAFEATTLAGGAGEVVDWLGTNGYQMSDEAPALFQDYVARGYLFVAVKLTGGAGIDEIHPLVVRYAGSKPCVPIKLTRVAAVENMGIRTFFLGTSRVGPINFKSIELNPARLDWMMFGANYKEVVSAAVDSAVANGQAFVTEYAGPTAILGAARLTPATWDVTQFASLSAIDAIDRMKQQGFFTCRRGPRPDAGSFPAPFDTPFCTSAHPLVLPLMRDFVPPPAMLTVTDGGAVLTDRATIEGYIYECPACYANQIDASGWDAPRFAAGLAERVIDPSRHADALVARWPYLTRMFTTISPAEMTEDPEFEAMPNLSGRPLPTLATRRITCSGASGMTLPDKRSIALTPTSSWPGFTSEMPWAEKIEELPAGIVLIDNTARIDELLSSWNESRGWPPAGTGGGGGTGGTAGGTGGAGTASGGTGTETIDGSRGGCSCHLGGRGSPKSGLALLVMAGLALRRPRRRA
jgi:MYXO-CTERM domain-containing protein